MRFHFSPRLLRILVWIILLSSCWAAVSQATSRRGKAVRSKKSTYQKARRSADRNLYRKYKDVYASALVIEAETGRVLFQKCPEMERAPASLTKMMTELITLEAIERGLVSLSDTVRVPAEVLSVKGSRVRLRPGERVPLSEVLHAMSISSANDAALALACHVAGSEQAFVRLMNSRAQELGMKKTRYVNPHGLDRADLPGSITTASDQAILARELIGHPQAIAISSTVADTIRGDQIIHTTNRLLGTCDGVDGLKTGYTGKAGFCLISTAEREGMRVISVLLGAPSNRRRFSESAGLLASAFARFRKIPVVRKGQDLGRACKIEGGSASQVRLVAGEDVAVCLPAANRAEIKVLVDAPPSVNSPVMRGSPLGLLRVLVGDSLAAAIPVVAARDVRKATLLDRVGLHIDTIE